MSLTHQLREYSMQHSLRGLPRAPYDGVTGFQSAIACLSRSHTAEENFTLFVDAVYYSLAAKAAVRAEEEQSLNARYAAVLDCLRIDNRRTERKIWRLFAKLFTRLAKHRKDILGTEYSRSEFVERKTRFDFHPECIYAQWTKEMFDRHSLKDDYLSKGRPVPLWHAGCKSGGMALAFAAHARSMGFKPASAMFVAMTDINRLYIRMAYIQVSVLGIPAICVHGDPAVGSEIERAFTLQGVRMVGPTRRSAQAILNFMHSRYDSGLTLPDPSEVHRKESDGTGDILCGESVILDSPYNSDFRYQLDCFGGSPSTILETAPPVAAPAGGT
jgi:hypothetical protein